MNIYNNVQSFVKEELAFYDEQADKSFEFAVNGEYLKAGATFASTSLRIALLTSSVAFAAFAAIPVIAAVAKGPLLTCAVYGALAAALYGGHRLVTQYDTTDFFHQVGLGLKQCSITAGDCAAAAKNWLNEWNV